MAEQQPIKKDAWSILEMIRWGTQYFAGRGIESPRLTMELIVCAATGLQRIGLYTNFEKPLSASELDIIRSAVKRRVKREPLQYILGSVDFYGLRIAVNPSVLIPRPETEFLVDHIVQRKRTTGAMSILDIGTGSGCIALALLRHLPEARVLAVDIKEDALAVARANAQALGLEQRITFQQCDILGAVPEGQFDVIVSNPPYIAPAEIAELEPEVRDYEPRTALEADDEVAFYRRFAGIFPELLKDGGEFCVEIGCGQEAAIHGFFREAGIQTADFKDLAGIVRCVYGTKMAYNSEPV